MSQGQKRAIDQDPDYESIPLQAQQKRLKLHEQDAKDAAVKKIEQIVRNQFCSEISAREAELDLINKRIYQAQMMLDRLRVGIITKYYATGGQAATESCGTPNRRGWEDSQQALASVHPTVRKFLGKAPPAHLQTTNKSDEGQHQNHAELRSSLTLVTEDFKEGKGTASRLDTKLSGKEAETGKDTSTARISRGPRCKDKVRVIVGNVSKYIPLDRRDDGGGDQATHKWLAYVRTAPEERCTIGDLVQRVRFFLHPSYRPHDLVEITEPPFQVQRKGWGEFPLRVQLHFHDRWTKHVDIIHQLKLDKTYTGLQTLGAETVVDLWLPASATRPENSSTAANDLSISNEGMNNTRLGRDRKAMESASTSSNETIVAEKVENEPKISTGYCKDILPDEPASHHSETSSTTENAPAVSSALSTEQPRISAELTKIEPGVSTDPADTDSCTTQSAEVDTSQLPQAKGSAGTPTVSAVIQMPSPIVLTGTASSPVSIAPKPVLPKASVAVRSNGVISPTFVKCTDALGRVLLIPATSLLSASTSPVQQATVSQQSSLLRPSSAAGVGTVVSDANVSIGTAVSAAVPKPLGFMLASTSNCAASASSVNVTTVAATSGASTAKGGTAVGVVHEKTASSLSKTPVKAATITVVPSSTPQVVGAAATNVLSNVVTLPLPKRGLAAAPSAAGSAGVKKIVSAVRLIRPALPFSAVGVNRTAVPAGTLRAAFPPAAVGTSGAVLLNTSSSAACAVPVLPSIKSGVVSTAANRTNLLSIICNKPAVASASTSVPVARGVSKQLVAIAPAAANVMCSKPASERTTVVVPQVAQSVMPSTSKVKSAPSTSTYTLVMLPGAGGSQGQVVLLPTASVAPTVPTPVVAQEKQSTQPPASPGNQSVHKIVYPAASLLAQPEKVDPVKELRDKMDAIRLSDFKDMREALFAVVAHFPLVGVTEFEKVNCFPYAATDGATYFSWPLPKQRASEWMRACDVRRTLQLLVERQQPSWFSSRLPSRRAIVLLCRRFGFTPLHPDAGGEIEEAEISTVDAGARNSYSEPSELISQLASAAEGAHEDSCNVEEDVDILGHYGADEVDSALGSREAGSSSLKQNTTLHNDSSPEKCLPRKAKVHLPLSPKAAFVREAASEVGVHLSSCELEPRIDVPVVEEMIVSACKNFATHLMRSALNMAFNRVSNERIPSVVTLEDTYRGILEIKECSFLANESLGIESTREGGGDDTHL
ncbi:YEATS domain-containing protein 2 [Rhipicephalus sanguineus]|uniref:YEATS domain-containing protein 2 n=1 Tax=Rhipicephalus sanguineus TaxID=34632 RepID=UPI0020C2D6A6|nr:YEATS domain-containing protein 2 [Rhipicephalus sanguineus]